MAWACRCTAYRTVVESSRTMEEINDKQDQATDPLRLDRCPDCGYLLTGLPGQGICPECGFAYRPDMIVLYGWGAGKRATLSTIRWRSVSWRLLWSMLSILPQIIMLLFVGANLYGLLLVMGFLAVDGTWVYRRWRVGQETPRPAQLRLMPEGFAQRVGTGKVKLRPWTRSTRVFVTRKKPPVYRIREEIVFFRLSMRPVIDVEIECDAETAERIKGRIKQWCERQ